MNASEYVPGIGGKFFRRGDIGFGTNFDPIPELTPGNPKYLLGPKGLSGVVSKEGVTFPEAQQAEQPATKK